MLSQIFHTCKNTVDILVEEFMDTSAHFARKKRVKPSTQTDVQRELQDSNKDELPEVKLD